MAPTPTRQKEQGLRNQCKIKKVKCKRRRGVRGERGKKNLTLPLYFSYSLLPIASRLLLIIFHFEFFIRLPLAALFNSPNIGNRVLPRASRLGGSQKSCQRGVGLQERKYSGRIKY